MEKTKKDPKNTPQQNSPHNYAAASHSSIMRLVERPWNWGRDETHDAIGNFTFEVSPMKQQRFLSFQVIYKAAKKKALRMAFLFSDPLLIFMPWKVRDNMWRDPA